MTLQHGDQLMLSCAAYATQLITCIATCWLGGLQNEILAQCCVHVQWMGAIRWRVGNSSNFMADLVLSIVNSELQPIFN